MSVCRICSDERALEINKLLLQGAMVRMVARKFTLSEQVLARHRRRHLRFGGVRTNLPKTLEEKLAALNEDGARLQAIAECGGATTASLQILKARVALIELEARLTGRLDSGGTTVNVNAGISAPAATPDDVARMVREYVEILGPDALQALPEYEAETVPLGDGPDEKPV